MPHQCLRCGEIFEEGSTQLLKGCPRCEGHRFFFTKQPLDEAQRTQISQEVNQDMTEKIMDLLMEKTKDTNATTGKWVTIKPKDLRKMLQHNIELSESPKPPTPIENKAPEFDKQNQKEIIDNIIKEAEQEHSPETIGIERPGKYTIDLKGLLEQEPIIVQKDGSYTIHLPSVFKMINQKNIKKK